MQIVRREKAIRYEKGTLTAFEYPTTDKEMNGAVTKIDGRYPEKGWLVNEKCKELIYVIEGSGTLVLRDQEVAFQAGDIIFVEPNEECYWQGTCTHFVAATPPWYPEQHKIEL